MCHDSIDLLVSVSCPYIGKDRNLLPYSRTQASAADVVQRPSKLDLLGKARKCITIHKHMGTNRTNAMFTQLSRRVPDPLNGLTT